jgi:hypothetical protein
VLLFAFAYSGPWLSEAFGVRASLLINGSALLLVGLFWAALVWVRFDGSVTTWRWFAYPGHIEIRPVGDDFFLRLTPDGVLWRRGDRVESHDWGQIESLEVIDGGHVQGPIDGPSLARLLFPITHAADQHAPVALRLMVRGRAFPVAWPLTDGSRAVADGDVDGLRSLIDRLGRSRSRNERETAISAGLPGTVAPEGSG